MIQAFGVFIFIEFLVDDAIKFRHKKEVIPYPRAVTCSFSLAHNAPPFVDILDPWVLVAPYMQGCPSDE